MKKTRSIISALLILLSLTACAGKAAKPTYAGTWELDHVVIGGAAFTRSELKAMGQDIQASIVLKDGGKAFVTLGADQGILNWSETENGIQIDNITFTMEDGLLCGESNDDILYFKKVSQSQLIEKTSEEGTRETETKLPENLMFPLPIEL